MLSDFVHRQNTSEKASDISSNSQIPGKESDSNFSGKQVEVISEESEPSFSYQTKTISSKMNNPLA